MQSHRDPGRRHSIGVIKNDVTVKHRGIDKHGCGKAVKLLWSLEEDSDGANV